jgi:hypothetical protein
VKKGWLVLVLCTADAPAALEVETEGHSLI